jgi:spore coat protein U-like protein
MKFCRWVGSLIGCVAFGLSGGAAIASPPAGESTFNVTATVAGRCTISATDASLGVYTAGSDLDGTSVITYRCTPGLSASISLNGGLESNLSSPRQMEPLSPPPTTYDGLAYQIYQDNQQQTVWGNGDFGTTPESVTGDGNSDTLTAYIVAPGNQPEATASAAESDTVTATINW